jgi:transposase
MGKPYSNDLRDRVVAAMATGRSCRDVGAAFAVAPSTAGNWYRRHQRVQSHAALAMGGDRRSKLTQHADWIAAQLAQTPELTLGEVRDELTGRGVVVSYASVWRMVRRLGLRHKKGRSSPVNRTGSMSPSPVTSGARRRPGSILPDWYSSTRPGPPPA